MQTPATTPVPANPNGFLTIAPIDSNLLNLGSNAIQPQCGDYPAITCNNGFVTEIGPTGNQFLYFTYIGGNGQTGVLGMALDTSAGCSEAGEAPLGSPCIYATGYTSSSDAGSSDGSTLGAASYDAFVAQMPSLIEPVCIPTATEVGLKVTVTLTCTQDFMGGQGAVNWGDGTSLTTISLNGTNTASTPVSHTYEASESVTSSVSMTDSAGNQTSFGTPFPVTQLAPVTWLSRRHRATRSWMDPRSCSQPTVSECGRRKRKQPKQCMGNLEYGWRRDCRTLRESPGRPHRAGYSGQVTDCGVYTPPPVQSPTITTSRGLMSATAPLSRIALT